MTFGEESSFVLFPLGKKRFALPAELVTELARPGRLQSFPQRTPMMTGVLARRGRIVPVCDVAGALVGAEAPPRRFYLIAKRQFEARMEWTAIPVTGECELATSVLQEPDDALPAYVTGLIYMGGETVEVVNLEQLIASEGRA
ncbi:MAG: chemotaxis protein CheW [Acidobacteriia bacterium]|nr:chemotaxis protein CheW [Terriglobia bacterium]